MKGLETIERIKLERFFFASVLLLLRVLVLHNPARLLFQALLGGHASCVPPRPKKKITRERNTITRTRVVVSGEDRPSLRLCCVT